MGARSVAARSLASQGGSRMGSRRGRRCGVAVGDLEDSEISLHRTESPRYLLL